MPIVTDRIVEKVVPATEVIEKIVPVPQVIEKIIPQKVESIETVEISKI